MQSDQSRITAGGCNAQSGWKSVFAGAAIQAGFPSFVRGLRPETYKLIPNGLQLGDRTVER
jgi:hypothetical protein